MKPNWIENLVKHVKFEINPYQIVIFADKSTSIESIPEYSELESKLTSTFPTILIDSSETQRSNQNNISLITVHQNPRPYSLFIIIDNEAQGFPYRKVLSDAVNLAGSSPKPRSRL